MNSKFAETLRKLRSERGLTQKQLGKELFVYPSTIARWENGSRMPDALMISRIAKYFGVDANRLFHLVAESDEIPNVIMVDDNEVILSHGLDVLGSVMPGAAITGFIKPKEAVEYAKLNAIALAVLDIEPGKASGLDLCRTLHKINPSTNVIFLTAYPDYALDAWRTDAVGFILKPMTPELVKEQLAKLRYPFQAGGVE